MNKRKLTQKIIHPPLKGLGKVVNHPMTKKGIKIKFYETLITGIALGSYICPPAQTIINPNSPRYVPIPIIRDNSQEELSSYLEQFRFPKDYL